jgi:hypothetical protein
LSVKKIIDFKKTKTNTASCSQPANVNDPMDRTDNESDESDSDDSDRAADNVASAQTRNSKLPIFLIDVQEEAIIKKFMKLHISVVPFVQNSINLHCFLMI